MRISKWILRCAQNDKPKAKATRSAPLSTDGTAAGLKAKEEDGPEEISPWTLLSQLAAVAGELLHFRPLRRREQRFRRSENFFDRRLV
jgi:hypothetical protein